MMERLTPEPRRQDPYRTDRKPAGTPQCPSCRGICVKGKWLPEREALGQLGKPAEPRRPLPGAAARAKPLPRLMCPACKQERDRFAMGVVELHGDSWKSEQDQIFETIEKTEEIARARNDQERILWSNVHRGITKIYVTLPELARHVGRVLQRTFKGKTEYHRSTEEPYLRVVWLADAPRRPGEAASSPARKASRRTARGNRSRQWRGRGRRGPGHHL